MAECRRLRWSAWQCPPFLFIVLGTTTVISMTAVYILASRYIEEPEMAAIVVILVTALFLIIGNFIINGFNRIAEANRMKTEFVSIASHQLRSPLSIFKWTLEVMEREMKNANTERALTFVHTFRDTTESMIRLVNSLLEVSRIEGGNLILKKEEVALTEITQGVLEDLKLYAHASNINLEFEATPALPNIVGDQQKIRMVVSNLTDNAIRYSRGGETVHISLQKNDGSLIFKVRDQGVGIPAAQYKNIFQKFFRATNGSRYQTEGTGLGLYIARELILAMGGKIGFESEENKGSIFWFTLPIINPIKNNN